VRPEDLGGLKSFAADYPESKPLLLYRGRERLEVDRIRCLPVDEFLRDLNPLNQSIASCLAGCRFLALPMVLQLSLSCVGC
jgi:hypothetical protein